MIELFRTPSWNFIGRRRWAYIVSVTAILLAMLALAARGLRYDIDFTGGTLVQVRFERPPAIERIRAALASVHLGDSIIQEFGDPREDIIRMAS
jgi:preprotein translocase subunit SecF